MTYVDWKGIPADDEKANRIFAERDAAIRLALEKEMEFLLYHLEYSGANLNRPDVFKAMWFYIDMGNKMRHGEIIDILKRMAAEEGILDIDK